MVVDTTLYDLLGVAPEATPKELDRAFRVKARELHPDKNRDDPDATSKFQAMKEAYEILKDEEKRQIYDEYGPKGLEEAAQGPGFGDILSRIFDIQGRQRPKTRTIVEELEVTLEELYNGCEKTVEYERHVVCGACQGKGTKEGTKATQCETCGGQGQVIANVGGFHTVMACPKCQGTGDMIAEGDQCPNCHGERLLAEKKTLEVHVDRGMEAGQKIVFQGQSDEIPDADTGDVVIVLKQTEHPVFERNHDDLLMRKEVSLYEALFGTNFVVTHLDGRKLIVESDKSVLNPDTVRVIPREGMPQKGNPFEKGSLFIQFKVVFPEKEQLTDELKAVLQKVVPPKPDEAAGLDLNDEDVYTVAMEPGNIEDFENAKRARGDRRNEAYMSNDEYDEEEDGAQAQCAPM